MRGILRVVAVALAVLFTASAAQAEWIERRKDQYPSEYSYLVIPLPYSLPGIGAGVLMPLQFNNFLGTYADAYAVVLTGDANGVVANLEDVHLIPKKLIARMFYQGLDHASYQLYSQRGMATRQTDYQLAELSAVNGMMGELLLTFWDRRFEVYVNTWEQSVKVTGFKDPVTQVRTVFPTPFEAKFSQTFLGALLDLTDDKYDPRKGIRVKTDFQSVPREKPYDPAYDVLNIGITGYVPMGKISTLALHMFRSDATVSSPGDLDANSIANRLCASPDPVYTAGCLTLPSTQSQVATTLLHNQNGDSAPLGGQNLMRAYTDSRFKGAHTLYLGAEFRWNLTEETTPFNYFIWKDVRTNVQVVFFHEQGSVSETLDTLGRDWRSDTGMGVRMVSASGAVYRFDYAVGDEGPNVTAIVSYPF